MSDPSVETVFDGHIVRVALERTTLPNDRTMTLEVVHHPGGAAVMVLDDRQRLCLLRQFRHAVGGWIWEAPAGKCDDQEDPARTAERELTEETGLTARRWQALGTVVSSPGFCDEVIHLFLATDLTHAESSPEDHEVFEVHWVPWRDAWDMAISGEIRDAKTLAGILRTGALLAGADGS